MDVKHAELNRLLFLADSLDQDKGVIELGVALPDNAVEEFITGVNELAKSLGGVPFYELEFDEFNEIVDAAITKKQHSEAQAAFARRGLTVIRGKSDLGSCL